VEATGRDRRCICRATLRTPGRFDAPRDNDYLRSNNNQAANHPGAGAMSIKVLTVLLAFTVGTLGAGPPGVALGQIAGCGQDAFSNAVDKAAAALRQHSADSQPRILAGIRQLKVRHGWRDDEEGDRARELLADAETDALDQKAAQLLATMDRLSEEGGQKPGDCAKLSELRATGEALQAAVRAKTDLVLRRINAALTMRSAEPLPGQAVTAVSKPPSLSPYPKSPPPVQRVDTNRLSEVARAATPPVERSALDSPIAAPSGPATPVLAAPPALSGPAGGWRVTTTPQPFPAPDTLPLPGPDQPAALPPPGPTASAQIPLAAVSPPPPPEPGKATDTYSIDEISGAARGVFGSLSSNLASVIEHAFSKYGRPTAYIIGEEGGGAFIAGVRYGSGRLYFRHQKQGRIYWHGPSVGYDFGAAGSRTLFLIYGLQEKSQLYSGFSGIDGSAYFLGGAGITFLSNQKVIMAPIRTGLGFRLGANVGYLRFTPKSTWNPF
jgi:hypothetical protein